MAKFLISGLINLETTLQVEAFPLTYEPVRYPFFGVASTVSGVGYNITKALQTLGDEVAFLSLIGDDAPGWLVRQALQQDGIPGVDVLDCPSPTAQSVILYEPGGRRQIHVDLKAIQEQVYPLERFQQVLERCNPELLVIGRGAQGALLAVREDSFIGSFPAPSLRPVVNTIGAGDAQFACFLHEYLTSPDPYRALQRAQVFAACKIGSAGAAQGFLDAPSLEELCSRHGIS
ncbi:MAG TPA: carbohydrate kinase family protein [Anaerolineales bacterium]|nr:carbohydrate kinase family protein [Anaerolineales bacterium]